MARPTKKEVWKRNIAYGVSKMTPEVIQKLEAAFAIGATVSEACDYADVSPATYYSWCQKNPELLERFDRMRTKLPLKAKENIARRIKGESILGDIGLSKWLVERQQPENYAETIKLQSSEGDDAKIVSEFEERLQQNMRDRIIKKAKEKV
jgi:hypothetical protein